VFKLFVERFEEDSKLLIEFTDSSKSNEQIEFNKWIINSIFDFVSVKMQNSDDAFRYFDDPKF
jgi:hypothetical protein